MGISNLLAALERATPGAVIEKTRFGRRATALWVELRSVPAVAKALSDAREEGLAAHGFENFSISQVGDALVASWFFSSGPETVVVRATAPLAEPAAVVEMPSVAAVWPAALPLEREAAELFGVRFAGSPDPARSTLLPDGWRGFPLRKEYVFPLEEPAERGPGDG